MMREVGPRSCLLCTARDQLSIMSENLTWKIPETEPAKNLVLALQVKRPGLDSLNVHYFFKKPAMIVCTYNPKLGIQRRVEPWDSRASQPGLVGDFQADPISEI